jgi:hypothetical protein
MVESEGKGRSFAALVLARVYAGGACSELATGRDGPHRPAMMVLAAPAGESGALVANIREGRKLRLFGDGIFGRDGERCEIPKRAKYQIHIQRTSVGDLLTVRHPDIFTYAPGLVTDHVSFVCLPPRERLEREAHRFDTGATLSHVRSLGFQPWDHEQERGIVGLDDALFSAFAALVVAQMAQQVSFPILPEPAFWAQLVCAMISNGVAQQQRPGRISDEQNASYAEIGVQETGFFRGVLVSAAQEAIGALLAEQTKLYLRR